MRKKNPQGMLLSINCFAGQINKVYYFSLLPRETWRTKPGTFVWLDCSLSLCLMRTTWLLLLGSLALVIISHVPALRSPLLPLKISISSQVPGSCCRAPSTSEPSPLPSGSSPSPAPEPSAQAGSHCCASTRHRESLSNGSPLKWHCCIQP